MSSCQLRTLGIFPQNWPSLLGTTHRARRDFAQTRMGHFREMHAERFSEGSKAGSVMRAPAQYYGNLCSAWEAFAAPVRLLEHH